MNNLEPKATYKDQQIKNISEVIPISRRSKLAEICCANENPEDELLKYETFFLNKNNQIAAYFETDKPVYIEHLNKDNENEEEPYKLVRIEEDDSQILLNSYDNIEFGIEDGTFTVEKNGLWGFIDGEGNKIIKPQYNRCCSFQSGLACVKKGDLCGVIDKKNKKVIPFKYYYCHDFYEGNAVVVNYKWSMELINTKDESLYKAFNFSKVYNPGNGSILVEDKAKKKFEILKIQRLTEE